MGLCVSVCGGLPLLENEKCGPCSSERSSPMATTTQLVIIGLTLARPSAARTRATQRARGPLPPAGCSEPPPDPRADLNLLRGMWTHVLCPLASADGAYEVQQALSQGQHGPKFCGHCRPPLHAERLPEMSSSRAACGVTARVFLSRRNSEPPGSGSSWTWAQGGDYAPSLALSHVLLPTRGFASLPPTLLPPPFYR